MPSGADALAAAERGLAAVGGSWATGCLVEGSDGRLVAHRLASPSRLPEAVRDAVLAGEPALLERALTARRTVGLVSSGPVLSGTVEGAGVLRVPLRPGALWLLVDAVPSLVELEQAVAHAGRLMHATAQEPAVRWCLEGHPDAQLPDTLAGCGQLWVLATVGAARVAQALRTAGHVVEDCALGPVDYLAVGAGTRTTTAQLLRVVRPALAEGRTGISAPAEDLRAARLQADLALRAAGPGTAISVEHDRSTVVLRHLAEALTELPHLGPDPLAALREYDDRRAAPMTETLRCWLDSGRDLAAATSALGIHPNTLRYRLQRVEQLLGVDLRRDTAAALELHLRLQAQPQLPRRTTSTGS